MRRTFGRQELNALSFDPLPERTAAGHLHPLGQRLIAQVDAELRAETPTHLVGNSGKRLIGGLGQCRGKDDGEVDVAPDLALSSGRAPEEIGLLDAADTREQPAPQEPLELPLDLALVSEERVKEREQCVVAVELIEVRSRDTLYLRDPLSGHVGQDLGRAVMRHPRTSRDLASACRKTVRQVVERAQDPDMSPAGEGVIERGVEAHRCLLVSLHTIWYL